MGRPTNIARKPAGSEPGRTPESEGLITHNTDYPEKLRVPETQGDVKNDENYDDGVTGNTGDRGQSSDPNAMPSMPNRKWWQYLPFFNQSYEDELVQYQNEMDYWRWQQENAYNDAASQVERYQQAGLNPNLMYEQGSAGSAGSMKPTQVPEYLGKKSMDLLQNAAKLTGAGFLARTQDSAAKLNKVKAITEATKQGLLGKQAAKTETENTILDRSADSLVLKNQLQAEGQEIMNNLNVKQQDKLSKDIEKLDKDIAYQTFINSLADVGLTIHDSVWARVMYLNLGKGEFNKWLMNRIPNFNDYNIDLRFPKNKN